MPDLSSSISALKKDLNDYAKLQMKQLQFEIVEFAAKERAKFIFKILMLFIVLFVMLFASFFSAVMINTVYDSPFLGFGLVSMSWFVMALLFLIFKNQFIQLFFKRYVENNIPS